MKPEKIDFNKVKELLNVNATQDWDDGGPSHSDLGTASFKLGVGGASRIQFLGSCVSSERKALVVMDVHTFTQHPGEVASNERINCHAVVGLQIIHGSKTYEHTVDISKVEGPYKYSELSKMQERVDSVKYFIGQRAEPQAKGKWDFERYGELPKGVSSSDPAGKPFQPL